MVMARNPACNTKATLHSDWLDANCIWRPRIKLNSPFEIFHHEKVLLGKFHGQYFWPRLTKRRGFRIDFSIKYFDCSIFEPFYQVALWNLLLFCNICFDSTSDVIVCIEMWRHRLAGLALPKKHSQILRAFSVCFSKFCVQKIFFIDFCKTFRNLLNQNVSLENFTVVKSFKTYSNQERNTLMIGKWQYLKYKDVKL